MTEGSGKGRVRFDSGGVFNGVKVFSATMINERQALGGEVTRWIAENPGFRITEIVVTQSSDESFHCLAMTVFFFDPDAAAKTSS